MTDQVELRCWAIEKAVECGRFGDCVGAAAEIMAFVLGAKIEFVLNEQESSNER
ncbi:hypothetical protein [Sphingomonas parapaucimobilis]|uniref:Uncharacterized protein n=1 Tax=Sphingomonas parapaucimobilis NBRC 15100 TaxID=1219049 RepID=A0A0A1W9G4_9SPHN|nr:hypothetical protein [Sphingomonas parapaucimobilis]GAM01756.1 hypothetical protein SP5_068_01240 [Sphingomonas parapaucimobilis NBRC 15100]